MISVLLGLSAMALVVYFRTDYIIQIRHGSAAHHRLLSVARPFPLSVFSVLPQLWIERINCEKNLEKTLEIVCWSWFLAATHRVFLAARVHTH